MTKEGQQFKIVQRNKKENKILGLKSGRAEQDRNHNKEPKNQNKNIFEQGTIVKWKTNYNKEKRKNIKQKCGKSE